MGSGHPETHRTRTGRTSCLAATGARHTADRDAAGHGPRGSDGASAPRRHLWTWGRRTSSGDVRGGDAPSLHVTLPGALVAERCWRVPAQRRRGVDPCRTAAAPVGGGWVPPVPEHRRQQIRRLTFGQPRPDREAQLAQQRRLFLGGRVLAPRGLRLHQAGVYLGSADNHIPPNYVVKRVTVQRKPLEVRICRLRNQSRVGTLPPSNSTPHWPVCWARR